ncbi:glycosyl hydrolases family 18-domain-containing protein [Lyophyllum atratum]|nr:glycosyl hydrolases family 18-domain-containing protein [Lyophyllum atratum]
MHLYNPKVSKFQPNPHQKSPRMKPYLSLSAFAGIPLLAIASKRHLQDSHYAKRADCRIISVASGDGCASLATKCGITAAQFTSFNPKLSCSTLQVDQWVCCSSGTLPSKRPSPNPDGSCFAVDVIDGSDCSQFSVKYNVTLAEIDTWNKNTWRWTGCAGLQPGMKICMSTGTPPLPTQNSTIACGLESVGNKKCPLNACCGKWGFCGLTDDFCETPDGAPGTGCQSNCQKISDFDKVGLSTSNPGRNLIGYYSNWSAHRSCNGVPNTVLPAVRPSDLDAKSFTHIVYSFGAVSRGDFKLIETQSDDKDLIAELQALKKINPNLKTMWAIGGWAFNDPPTQDIFSLAVRTSSSRTTFVNNIISGLTSYGFDGIDIDWGLSFVFCSQQHAPIIVNIEYPGTERGGIDADGQNFLAFLKELYAKTSSKNLQISFTVPASYWYLQQFPIVQMQDYTNWINLMTYDIHGSWDIKFGTGVLPHTAIPDINAAVNMLLKAGVKMGKINLGIGFYGRSFTLSDPNCKDAGCPFSGGGTKGPCTDGEGFLSYGEIDYLIQSKGLKPTYNSTSKTMTLVYANQWIGYEDASTLATKLEYVLKRTMPGVLIWAVDLDKNNQLLSAASTDRSEHSGHV